jgi:RNA polymerase sigma-70 factor (ECF subfamily)
MMESVKKQMLQFPGNETPDNSQDAEARQDAHFLASIAEGDHQALASLYRRRGPVIYSLLVRMLGNKMEAQDVMQETFILAWKRARSYDPVRSSPMAWLVMIARSKAIDHLRRRSRHAAGNASYEREIISLEVEVINPGVYEQEELSAACALALRNLPEAQSQALQLAFFRGWSHQEIAGAVREPLGTIKARIRRGLLALRQALKDYHA